MLLAPEMITQWGGTGFHGRSEGMRHALFIRDVKIAIGFGRLRRWRLVSLAMLLVLCCMPLVWLVRRAAVAVLSWVCV